ncbi:MAG: phosphatidylglycerophosphatase A [Deltaproteobacteria bacterium]|nr:phosphatidylglycerophosphatase A [Deltaproteobacteria bacterium]
MHKIRPFECMRLLMATALGLGLLPGAPGTWGTLLGVLIHFFVIVSLPVEYISGALALALLMVCAGNIALAPWAMEYWKAKDPSRFVLDEVAGYLVVPLLFRHGEAWQVMLWGFLLFRLFDIIKIPPARQIDRMMSGGWGILLDDLVSGLYAALVMYAFRWMGALAGV